MYSPTFRSSLASGSFYNSQDTWATAGMFACPAIQTTSLDSRPSLLCHKPSGFTFVRGLRSLARNIGASHGVCTDIDECTSGLASCASPSVATCVNTRGGYFCSCNDGYEGDGRQCVASPSTADAHISIAMDYEKTVAAAGGTEMLKEALIDAILQAIPGLADRTRIEVTSIYEGSIHALVRIHPPSQDATVYVEGSDVPRQLTAAEVLLALQEQLTEPLSPLRTGPFGEYAAYATIERYVFLDRAAANGTFDLLAFLTDWLPAWLRDAVPREVLAAMELLLLLSCIAAVVICVIRAVKRCSERNAQARAALVHDRRRSRESGKDARDIVAARLTKLSLAAFAKPQAKLQQKRLLHSSRRMLGPPDAVTF
ncbi:hypothetical protein Emag_000493 [Eimeria magna]